MTNSKQKGKRGELEAAAELQRLFGVDVRRGQQYSGANGDADVVGLPGVHVEVKRTEALRLYEAVDQSMMDAMADEVALVLHRKSREPWVAIVRLDDLPRLVERLYLLLADQQ